MKILRLFNKEQWTALVTVVLCAFFTVTGFLGGSAAPEPFTDEAEERAYNRPPGRFSEFVDDAFAPYWKGKPIWFTEMSNRLTVPNVRPPEPREEDLTAPLFRPGPTLDAYNALAIKSKYPFLTTGAPAIAEADAPPAAEVEALKKLEEPAVPPRLDRRAERRIEHSRLTLKTGKVFHGRVVLDGADELRFFDKDGKQMMIIPRDKVLSLEYNHTYEEQYRLDSRGIKSGPLEAQERLKLARKLIELGMIVEARGELRRAVELRKDYTEAYLLLGQVCVEEGDFDGAVAAYGAGIEGGAAPMEMHYELGRCHRELGFFEGAAAAFEKSLEASPGSVAPKLALARTLLEMGRHAAGGAMANDFFIKMAAVRSTTSADMTEGYTIRGLASLRGGDLAKARQDLAEALKLGKPAEALNGMAVIDMLEGNPKAAAEGFIAALKADQYLTDAWTNLGAMLLLAGKWAEAEAIYGAAAQRDPLSVDALAGAGLAQLMAGKKEGQAPLEKVVQLDPRHPPSRTLLGGLKLKEGAVDAALLDFVAALRGDPHYLPAYYGAALAYLRSARKIAESGTEKDLAKAQEIRVNAETLLRTLSDSDPSRSATWVALGCAYAVMARPDDARQALRRGADGRPDDPLISYARGYVEFWYAPGDSAETRLDSALVEFIRGSKLPPASGEAHVKACLKAATAIEIWKATSERLNETFEREGADVGNNWIVSDKKYGVKITLDGAPASRRAKFAGKQAIADMGITTMERPIPSENFHSLEATFIPDATDKAEYGLSIYFLKQGATRMGFHAGFSKGKLMFNAYASDTGDMDRKDMVQGWTLCKVDPPDPKAITLRVTRGENRARPTFDLWYFDPAKGEWIVAQKEIVVQGLGGTREGWHVSIFGRAEKDRDCVFYVDNVRIYERTRK